MRWYWELSGLYYDKIAHMIGGFTLGLVVFASFLAYILYSKYEMQRKTVLVLTALITFLFGLFWEIEEIAIDSVVDDVMRPAVGVDETNAVAPVGVNQIVNDQRAGVAAINRDATVAGVAPIAKDTIEFDVDILILIVATEQRDRLTAGTGNRQAADGYEL